MVVAVPVPEDRVRADQEAQEEVRVPVDQEILEVVQTIILEAVQVQVLQEEVLLL